MRPVDDVKLGVYIDLRQPGSGDSANRAAGYEAALELCERVDDLGADSIWLSEHHQFPDGYLPQPLTFAAALAARTRRVRIGTAVLLAPIRSAPHIAEQAAIVDLVSGGRLDLGLGAGYLRSEFELFGVDESRPTETLFERVAQVREILESGTLTPRPVQSPLPLWIGSNGRKGAYRAGCLGAPLLSPRPALIDAYLSGMEQSGHPADTARMAGPVNVFLTDDPERDRAVVASYYQYLWRTYAEAAGGNESEVDVDHALRLGLAGGLRGLLVTTPQDAARQIEAHFGGTPVETIFTWGWLPGIPGPLVDRHIELWCTQLRRLLDLDRG